MPKFVNAKKPSDYARELYQIHEELEELRERQKVLEERAEFLEAFLKRKYPEGMLFASGDGYEMQIEFRRFERMILDQAKAKAILAKMGKRIPMRRTIIRQTSIDYVYE